AIENAELASARTQLAHAYWLRDIAETQLGRDSEFRGLALPIYEELGDLVGQAKVLNNLGFRAYYEGRWEDALDYYSRSADASAPAGDTETTASVRNNEAEILSDQGHLDRADQLFEEALRIWRGAGHATGVAFATGNRGRSAARRGTFQEAQRLLADAR